MTLPFGLRPETLVMTLQLQYCCGYGAGICIYDLTKLRPLSAGRCGKKGKKRIDERQGVATCDGRELDTSKGCYVQPIGIIHSCFKTCLGHEVSPGFSGGLEHFSHIWIIFVFHLNTNGKYTRAHDGLRSDSHRHTFRVRNVSLIVRCMTSNTSGHLCTRSPHRPNPIGITLTRVERVDMCKRTVYLTGVDLLDGTPVLDIKPYIAVPDPSWTTPDHVSYQIVDTVRVKYCFALSPQPKLHTDGKPDTSLFRF
ncbi:putative trmO-like domain, YaeB-like superfamily protein [Plasmopara halstedii]